MQLRDAAFETKTFFFVTAVLKDIDTKVVAVEMVLCWSFESKS